MKELNNLEMVRSFAFIYCFTGEKPLVHKYIYYFRELQENLIRSHAAGKVLLNNIYYNQNFYSKLNVKWVK